ncbi:MAG: chitinase [Phenylobacterium sp.]
MTPGGNNNTYNNNSGKVVGTYFVEWGVYGRAFNVDNIPAQNLTHILYGFIPVCGVNDSLKDSNPSGHNILVADCAGLPDGSLVIHDMFAALQKGQKGAATGSYKGNFGQLMALKQAQPELTIIPSIGGWTLSDPFYAFSDPAARKVFVDSAEEFLRTWKFFDGIDIDWEYPGGGGANPDLGDPATGGATYLALMSELRVMLDSLSAEKGRDYQLTSAVGAGRSKIELIDYQAVTEVVDNIFLMSYDYYGAWDTNKLGHQAGVYAPDFRQGDAMTQDFNLAGGLAMMQAQGADMSKVAVGAAMYGRGWTGVTGIAPGASPFTGAGTDGTAGTWEPGILDYKAIATMASSSEWVEGYDAVAEGAYIYKASTGDLISYDNARSVKAKTAIVCAEDLAGIFSWEIDADNGDILNAMNEGIMDCGTPPVNRAPSARAGADQTVQSGAGSVSLSGAASTDADGDALTYSWTQTGGASVSLTGANAAVASFATPTVSADATLTFALTVSDGEKSSTDSVSVTVQADVVVGNNAPTISLPADMMVDTGASFSVATTAADPDGDAITVTYNVPAGLTVVSSDNSGLSLTAPTVTADTAYTISATVTDGELSATDSIVVTVKAEDVTNPCSATDPDAANHAAWSASGIYNGGDKVSFNGLVYSAKWWTQGNQPDSAGSPWALSSNVELPYSPTAAYNGGDQVNHEGSRYQAAYWTKNETPGVAAVWSNIGPATCN